MLNSTPARATSTLLVVTFVILAAAGPASATWSIVAVDEDTGEVGAAIASCSSAAALGDADEVLAPIVLVPGRGVGVVQGTIRPSAIDEMTALLGEEGLAPQALVDALLAGEQDQSLISVRQYGVAILGHQAEPIGLHNGVDNGPTSVVLPADRAAVQTVRVADPTVGEQTLSAYSAARAEGKPLGDALAFAIEAGAQAGGDVDCGRQRALFAQLAVAHPADGDGRRPSTLLTVTVDEDDGQNPVTILAEAYLEGDRGWINAGRRSPTLLPRWIVFAVGLTLAAASVVVIRRGMTMG